MNQENWQKAKQIFNDALKLPAEERAKYLDEVCLDDPLLGEQVQTLLESYESGFLEETAVHKVAEIISGSSLQVGQQIGRYEIKEILGAGGMGEVFLAEDTELRRPVAVKVLHPEVAEDKERVSRFIQEARAASALNHPNILTIHEIGKFEDSRFIVSEYVKGETLRQRLKRENLDLPKSLDIAAQVAAALEAAHEAGIIHRDIKPENIIVRSDGLVKVLDFGLAKLTEPIAVGVDFESSTLAEVRTNPGVVMGTIAYMSPEQARGVAVDARTDIWSLGVVLYEMLSGRLPFPGETTSDIIASILKTEAEPFENLNNEIPREIEEICFKALAKDPIGRYQTAQDFLQDIRRAKKHLESASEQTTVKKLNYADERKTEPTRHRPTVSAEYIVTSIKSHKFVTLGVLALLTFFGIGVGVYKFTNVLKTETSPFSASQKLNIAPLVTLGKVSNITISPDGKYGAYVTRDGNMSSLRLRQLATTSDVEIIPPIENVIRDLSFTPDGNYIYYVTLDMLFKIPALGGSPTKIVGILDKYTYVSSQAAVSPDGKTIVFSRDDEEAGISFLQAANSDGTNERTIIKYSEPSRIYGEPQSWSPDGKSVVYGASTREKDGLHIKLFGINVSDGSQQQLSESEWLEIGSIVWLPNGNLMVCGKLRPSDEYTQSQLWLIAPNTPPQPITSDLNGYQSVSVTAKGDMLLAMQVKTPRDLWIVPNNDASLAKQITTSGEVREFSWMPDGKIAFGSYESGNLDIWTMNADGSNRKQLTANQGINILSSVTPDGRYIIFTRATAFGNPRFMNNTFNVTNVWRMDADGSNQKQLTNENDISPESSPDGKWIYYTERTEDGRNICKVSIDGGAPVKLVTTTGSFPFIAVSPRTGMIAFLGREGATPKLIILSPDDHKPIKTFPIPKTAISAPAKWLPDESAIAYRDSRNNANVWIMPFNGQGETKPLTNFTTARMFGYNWSPDGKQLLVGRGTQTSEAVLITRAK